MKLDISKVRALFSTTDFSRGMEYYRQGRVGAMVSSSEDGHELVTCAVRGSRTYRVRFLELGNGYYRIGCNCPRFEDVGRCKHVAAAMIAYSERPVMNTSSVSDWRAKQLLQSYLQRSQRTSMPEGDVRLVPQIDNIYVRHRDYPIFTFRVGREKLYVVKNVREFLTNVANRKTVVYGKNLTLDHSLEQFDPLSQKMIRLLMNEYDEFRSMRGGDMRYSAGYFEKNQVHLTGDSFDRWFDLLSSQNLETASGRTMQMLSEDPQVKVRLEKQENLAQLTITTDIPAEFFGSTQSLYALSVDKLLRCSEVFRDRVYPLLEQGERSMQIALTDLPTFCSCVLPEVEELVTIEDPDELLQNHRPEECVPCFYLDMEDEILTLKLTYRYVDLEITDNAELSETENIRRNVRTERAASMTAEKYFQLNDQGYYLADQDAVYNFLTGSLEEFHACGEVYISDRLRRKRIQPAGASIGISVSDGLLRLEMDTGGFPPEELSALYQSLLRRKKYHRLPDGRYLELNGSACEKMAEMAQMLQLSKRDLGSKAIALPAFRGLYLDSLLANSEGIQVSRDQKFRQMIRNFKAVEDGDHVLPPALEGVLRPYQKIGFQWLKTLESCGFGGILADEMGLGKTLQVISYLATVPNHSVGLPNLVVCPTSLILNWGDELKKFAPELSVALILGNAAERRKLRQESHNRDLWITSYELLRQDLPDYLDQQFYCCILDEGQHIKNQSTQVSKAVKQIVCKQRFVLTGTPIENRLSELWNLFDFLMPGYLFSHTAFRDRLEKPIIKNQNPEAAAQLRKLVQPFVLRRLKKDVLKELPPKIEHTRRITLSEQEKKTYFASVQAFRDTLGDGQGKLQILSALTQLRQICCDPGLCFENYEGSASKLEACMELCETMVENGHQILLFSQFTSMLERIDSRLKEKGITSFTLQGSTPKEKRAQLVKAFNAGEASVFLISLKAGGTGLNLTAADVVIHYDPWWNLAAQDQATDRAHRIGQQTHVQVYKLITKDTIEEKILDLQEKKASLMDAISGNDGSVLHMSKEELMALLEESCE